MEFNYALLVKYLIGSLSSEEMEEVMRWRDLSAENETVFSEVLRLRLSWNTAKYADNERIDMALEKVNVRINRARRYRIARSLLKYAAVILLLVSFSAVGWNYFKPETYMTIALGDSEGVKKVTLDDGSIVWLRGNSVLKIPNTGLAWVTGEASVSPKPSVMGVPVTSSNFFSHSTGMGADPEIQNMIWCRSYWARFFCCNREI